MALTDPYVSLAELKQFMGHTATDADDGELTDALDSATTEIMRHCNRNFNKVTSATARIFKPLNIAQCKIDDIYDTTGMIVESDPSGTGDFNTVLAAADYELSPFNGIVDGEPGWPYYRIKSLRGAGFYPYAGTLYRREGTVRVTALWGWSEIPASVKMACKIMAQANWKLRDAPFGVAGISNFGVMRVRDNPMAMAKLSKYVDNPVLVG